MDDTRDVTKDRQEDVDEKVGTAATLEEDAGRWQEDCKHNLEDITNVLVSSRCTVDHTNVRAQ